MDKSSSSNSDMVFYKTKRIFFQDRFVHILCLEQNGPSALLALSNCLLLKGVIHLGMNLGDNIISEQMLIKTLHASTKKRVSIALLKQRMSQLGQSMELCTKFLSIDAIHPCHANYLFVLLDVVLYHGFVVDPEDEDIVMALGANTYADIKRGLAAHLSKNSSGSVTNQERSEDTEFSHLTTYQWKLIQGLFDDFPTGLTYYGLKCLQKQLKEKEISVLLLDGIFHLIFKHNGLLYLLQNDVAYFSTSVTWKSFEHVDNNGSVLTSEFELYDQRYMVQRSIVAEMKLCLSKPREENLDYSARIVNFGGARHVVVYSDYPSLLLALGNLSLFMSKFDPGWDEDFVQTNLNSAALVNPIIKVLLAGEANIDREDLKKSLLELGEPAYFSVSFESPFAIRTSADLDVFSGIEHLFGHSFIVGPEHGRVASLLGSKFYDDICDEKGASQRLCFCCFGYSLLFVVPWLCRFLIRLILSAGHLVDNFLKKNHTQMTSYGLKLLQERLVERSGCALLWNEQFSTVVKQNGKLYSTEWFEVSA